ncbi:Hypothetical_protein [Hexamita inflata]|uniref:Hypothetical_protein n=1 Tax=Hexamita inflata TaxID=28002 RepID=A0ABP1ISW6_9EUKA
MDNILKGLSGIVHKICGIKLSPLQSEVLINILSANDQQIDNIITDIFQLNKEQQDQFHSMFKQVLSSGKCSASDNYLEYPSYNQQQSFEYKQQVSVTNQLQQMQIMQRALACGCVNNINFNNSLLTVQFDSQVALNLFTYFNKFEPTVEQEPEEHRQLTVKPQMKQQPVKQKEAPQKPLPASKQDDFKFSESEDKSDFSFGDDKHNDEHKDEQEQESADPIYIQAYSKNKDMSNIDLISTLLELVDINAEDVIIYEKAKGKGAIFKFYSLDNCKEFSKTFSSKFDQAKESQVFIKKALAHADIAQELKLYKIVK